MKILIIIPAFNEEKTVQSVISDLRSYGYNNIIVVDDGSTDNTNKFLNKIKVIVVKHVVNRGLGAALATGFEYAKRNNFDIVVTFDSDGQHQAKDLQKLLAPLISDQFDVAIGSRFRGDLSKMPFNRLVINLLSNVMTFIFYGVVSTDSLSGLRAFNKKSLNSIKIKTDGMEVSNEFLKEIKRNKLKLKEVPIDAVYSDDTIKGSKQERLATFKIPLKLISQMFS